MSPRPEPSCWSSWECRHWYHSVAARTRPGQSGSSCRQSRRVCPWRPSWACWADTALPSSLCCSACSGPDPPQASPPPGGRRWGCEPGRSWTGSPGHPAWWGRRTWSPSVGVSALKWPGRSPGKQTRASGRSRLASPSSRPPPASSGSPPETDWLAEHDSKGVSGVR